MIVYNILENVNGNMHVYNFQKAKDAEKCFKDIFASHADDKTDENNEDVKTCLDKGVAFLPNNVQLYYCSNMLN